MKKALDHARYIIEVQELHEKSKGSAAEFAAPMPGELQMARALIEAERIIGSVLDCGDDRMDDDTFTAATTWLEDNT